MVKNVKVLNKQTQQLLVIILLKINKINMKNIIVMLFITFNLQSQIDKQLHFLANSNGAPLIGVTAYNLGLTQIQALTLSAISMTIIDFSKEISDKQRGGEFSWTDINADGKGLVTGLFITLVINGITQHIRDKRTAKKAYENYKKMELFN